ncbi:molybdate ABC transporter permease subunit [Puniceicoccus vermicola]|uniref:Molybdenum transport system permease n=1 Tax=Puniceicoccus vermicola TaxID=388746 RepID=A0A7X1AY60_9BACT|nr:molybdate ABC transporter permease subunit [Puniceicoccus vermicola]
MSSILQTLIHTVLWASLSTLFAFSLSLPLGYALARFSFPGKRILATLTSLPLVLPPTAVGYLLLCLLADHGPLGRDFLGLDLQILLTWKAVILACTVMSLPLVIRTTRVSFEEVDPRLEKMSLTLGIGRIRTFMTVTLPLAHRGLIAAAILGFTRAMGEFGATVIVAGNIPGHTQTLSSAIYSAQQAGNDGRANVLVAVALVIGFIAIFITEWLGRDPSLSSRRRAL